MSRLIDADEALNLIDGETKVETNTNEKAFNDALEVAIQIIDTQKTVEAIPVDWLRMWFTKEASLIGITLMGEIESDWEKENGEKTV